MSSCRLPERQIGEPSGVQGKAKQRTYKYEALVDFAEIPVSDLQTSRASAEHRKSGSQTRPLALLGQCRSSSFRYLHLLCSPSILFTSSKTPFSRLGVLTTPSFCRTQPT